jgi:hypothetical protein
MQEYGIMKYDVQLCCFIDTIARFYYSPYKLSENVGDGMRQFLLHPIITDATWVPYCEYGRQIQGSVHAAHQGKRIQNNHQPAWKPGGKAP